jgi:hypothetical protein
MRVFGCPAYIHVDKSQRRKLDDRAWKGVFVGYASESPAWLVYNLATRRVVSTRNVMFDEDALLSMGESNAEQRNDDEKDSIPRTMCSEERDTPSGESQHPPPRGQPGGMLRPCRPDVPLPGIMNELRRLWYVLDTNDIHITPRYIRSAANTWADKLSRHLDSDEWRLDPSVFHEMNIQFGPHTIDRFASALNTLLPRYNAKSLDPSCEEVNSLHLADLSWQEENNWCNPPWLLLPDLTQKLQPSGASATMVVPRWQGRAWHQALTELACHETVLPARAHLFRPERRYGCGTIGKPHCPVTVFRIPFRPGCTSAGALPVLP